MIDYLIIFGLFIVIIVEFFFVQWVIEQVSKEKTTLLEENSRLVKALIAKNATEYVMTTSIDKVPEQKQTQEEDDVQQDVSQLDDDQFDAFIDKANGKIKK